MAAASDDILELIRRFLAAQTDVASVPRIEGVERVAVGRSRENWVFDAEWASGPDGAPVGPSIEPLIVRRDPLGGLLETSRSEEFAVLRALEATAVPAPRVRWLDADGTYLGRPSLIMVREPGVCDYYVVNGDRPLATRLMLARQFCDLLATIHTLDWAGAGMGAFLPDPGRRAAHHELDRWEAVLRRDQLEPHPELELVLGWLRHTAPDGARTVLVHGDFKPGNVLLDGDRIVALLDWELAHLGDPMEDLGWITQPLRQREHLIPGAWEQAELFARYTDRTGIEVDEAAVAWWNVLASFKTAVMQVSGLRSFIEGRSDEPYRPTATVLRSLLDAVAPPDPAARVDEAVDPTPTGYILDQHLQGAQRLLDQVAGDIGLSPPGAAMVADVRRLLRQVAAGWPGTLRFLLDDNARLEQLLAELGSVVPPDVKETDRVPVVADVHRRNLDLRALLADAAPTTAARARVAAVLRQRLDVDPVTRRSVSTGDRRRR